MDSTTLKERINNLTVAEAMELCFLESLTPTAPEFSTRTQKPAMDNNVYANIFPELSLKNIKVMKAVESYVALRKLRMHVDAPDSVTDGELINITLEILAKNSKP